MQAVRRWAAVAAGVATTVTGALFFTPEANAAPVPVPAGYAFAQQGACGDWWTETATEYQSVYVCAGTGTSVETITATPQSGPYLYAGVFRCDKFGDVCEYQNVIGHPSESDVTIDPLLRTAAVSTTSDGCAINVSFAGGALEPQLSSYHFEGAGGEFVLNANAGGSAVTYRDAQWSGSVCGMPIKGGSQQAQVWRGGGGGVSVGAVGGE